MYGISAGAKYAITAASLIPDVSLVIAGSPFDYTTEAFKGTKALNQSTFSWRGKPLPYVFGYYNTTRVYTSNPGGWPPTVYREFSARAAA